MNTTDLRTPWEAIRARFMFRDVNDRGHDLALASVTKEGGVEFRSDLSYSVWNPGDDTTGYKRVAPGDFVIGLRSFESGLGYSTIEGLVSPAYTVLRPIRPLVGNYYRYLFKSVEFVALLNNASQGIRDGKTVSAADFYDLWLPYPDLDTQRTIADFLDAETAHLHHLTTKKRRLRELLEERMTALVDREVAGLFDRFGATALRRRVAGIEQGWSPECDSVPAEPDEWGVIKTSAVTSGTFVPYENKRLPSGVSADLRWQLRDGDVLIVRGSGSPDLVGRTAIVNSEGRRLLLADLIYRLVRPKDLPEFLAIALSSARSRAFFAASIRTDAGSTLKLRSDDVLAVPIPDLPPARQSESIGRVKDQLTRLSELGLKVDAQIDLLRERQSALIAAAVTGKSPIHGVAA